MKYEKLPSHPNPCFHSLPLNYTSYDKRNAVLQLVPALKAGDMLTWGIAPCLVLDAGGDAAQEALFKDGEGAAAGALAHRGADGAEVGAGGGSRRGVAAVKVDEAEDIGGAAHGAAAQAGAGRVGHLALDDVGGEGDGAGGREEGGDDRGELHFGGWGFCFFDYIKSRESERSLWVWVERR